MSRRIILVVDDQVLVCEALEVLLSNAGYRVVTARDGVAALAAIEHTPPDLLITDVGMPRLDGLALIETLRARGIAVPVIVMNGDPNVLERQSIPTIRKPVDFERLLNLVIAQFWGPPHDDREKLPRQRRLDD